MAAEPTVFIIDDDPAICQSMTWLVESIGLRAQAFDSPAGFLEAYEPSTPGCLVLDVRLRGMSGLDFQCQMAELGIALPVIVMSGFADDSACDRAIKGGAVDFIKKPFSNQEILDLIRRCLERDARAR